jgi:hypothetical protein
MKKRYLYSFYKIEAVLDNNNRWMNCPICNKYMLFSQKQFGIRNNKTKEEIGNIYCSKPCAEFGLLQII